jgi:hypothetical protein
MLNLNELSRNYRAVVKSAIKLATSRNWYLETTGEFPVNTTLAYLEHLHTKARQGKVKVSSILSYMSALENAHLQSGIKWRARTDYQVKFKMKEIKKDRSIPQRFIQQDYEFTFKDLTLFCKSLDVSRLEDVVAGALASTLFWSMGRVYEVLHTAEAPRLSIRTVHQSPLGLWQILLERPKVMKETIQILTPVESDGITRANTWLTILMEEQKGRHKSPWQLNMQKHADTDWFYNKLRTNMGKSMEGLGPSSFRAGGLTHMASVGVPLDQLQLLGRWESDAWKRYLRNHPWVISRIMRTKTGLDDS